MTAEKWAQIRGMVLENFKDAEKGQEDLDDDSGGSMEVIEFNGPVGRMRLEYITRPVVLGKNVSGSRRIGSHHEIDYVYSDSEVTQTLKAYKFDESEQEWVEMDFKNSFTL